MNLLVLDCLPSDLRAVLTCRDLTAGQVLFQPGDPAVALFMVETGRLRLARNTSEGKLVTIQVARAGQSLAETALFTEFYSEEAVAEIASRVIVYPKQFLLRALCNHADLAESFMELLTQQIQLLQLRLELRDLRSAHERVLQYLRHVAQPPEASTVSFDRPLKDIASELGLTPETLSRSLSRLQREGLITRVKQQITLNNLAVA